MFFIINKSKFLSAEQTRSKTLVNAYRAIKNYPMHATELLLDNYLLQHYDISLKDACIRLLLALTFCEDKYGNLVFLFKNPEHDKLARLITYGNGIIPGSMILRTAFS